jgi:hypothetical protein
MSHLAVSDSAVDWREQSGPRPGHTFKKTAAINGIIVKVPDNAFCHLLTFRSNRRSDFKKEISGIWSESKPNRHGFTRAPNAVFSQMRPVRVGFSFFSP